MYPEEPRGQIAHHLNTLVALICGIVGSQQTNLPAIAGHAPSASQVSSQIKQFKRWLMNERIEEEVYFLPLLAHMLTQSGRADLGETFFSD